MLAGLESPGVGALNIVRSAVRHDQVGPVGVDAGVAGGRGQLGGGLAHAVSVGFAGVADVFAAGVDIPVAVGGAIAVDQNALSRGHAGQPADVFTATVDRAGGVAVVDKAPVLPHQAADPGGVAAEGYRGPGVAGADHAVVFPHQAADCAQGVAHRSGYIAADDLGVIRINVGIPDTLIPIIALAAADHAGQPANTLPAADINVHQADAFQPGGVIHLAQNAEQAHANDAAAVVNVEVGDGVAVALKDGRVGGNNQLRAGVGRGKGGLGVGTVADRRPALAAVPVSVVGAVAGRAGVKVQVGAQFVANAAGVRAAHAGGRIGEGAGGVTGVGGGDGGWGLVKDGQVGGGAVPVQVVAHGVELRQGANVNQPVVVVIVVGGGVAGNRNRVGFVAAAGGLDQDADVRGGAGGAEVNDVGCGIAEELTGNGKAGSA